MKLMWKYILIGFVTVIAEWIFLGAFSTVFDGMGALGGIVLGVGVFLAFEMVICTGVILSKLNTDEDR